VIGSEGGKVNAGGVCAGAQAGKDDEKRHPMNARKFHVITS
jgi:hypothetical protein